MDELLSNIKHMNTVLQQQYESDILIGIFFITVTAVYFKDLKLHKSILKRSGGDIILPDWYQAGPSPILFLLQTRNAWTNPLWENDAQKQNVLALWPQQCNPQTIC